MTEMSQIRRSSATLTQSEKKHTTGCTKQYETTYGTGNREVVDSFPRRRQQEKVSGHGSSLKR